MNSSVLSNEDILKLAFDRGLIAFNDLLIKPDVTEDEFPIVLTNPEPDDDLPIVLSHVVSSKKRPSLSDDKDKKKKLKISSDQDKLLTFEHENLNFTHLAYVPNSVVPSRSHPGCNCPSPEAKRVIKKNIFHLSKAFCNENGDPRGFVTAHAGLKYYRKRFRNRKAYYPIKLWFNYHNGYFRLCKWEMNPPNAQKESGTSIGSLALMFGERNSTKFQNDLYVSIEYTEGIMPVEYDLVGNFFYSHEFK